MLEAPKHFNIVEYLSRRRQEERRNSHDLLWENIDAGAWNKLRRLSGQELSDEDKIAIQANHYFPVLAQFFIVTSRTIQEIEDRHVREILQYGASRRISSIRRAVNRIIQIAPHDREKRLSEDERGEVSDSILLLYVHILGVLDAFAIALHRKFSSRLEFSERKADLLSKSFRKSLGVSEIGEIIERNDLWFARVKVELRNRYVHRIPPYVPDAQFTSTEAERYSQLAKIELELIAAGNFDEAARVQAEKDSLGVFAPVLSFSESNHHMVLHPTVLDDTFRFNCIVLDLIEIALPLFSADD
ncbi:MAG: hypothetical protein KBF78_04770 [Fuscovulum sp.]|nr:hypothetical protein [Fuscovulum sp.]